MINLGRFVFHEPVQAPSGSLLWTFTTAQSRKKSHSLITGYVQETPCCCCCFCWEMAICCSPLHLTLEKTVSKHSLFIPWPVLRGSQLYLLFHPATFHHPCGSLGTILSSLSFLRWGPELCRLVNTDLSSGEVVALIFFLARGNQFAFLFIITELKFWQNYLL